MAQAFDDATAFMKTQHFKAQRSSVKAFAKAYMPAKPKKNGPKSDKEPQAAEVAVVVDGDEVEKAEDIE